MRYDAYALDYGCYVDLLATSDRAPRGLLVTDDDERLDVPPDEPIEEFFDDNKPIGSVSVDIQPSAGDLPRNYAAERLAQVEPIMHSVTPSTAASARVVSGSSSRLMAIRSRSAIGAVL